MTLSRWLMAVSCLLLFWLIAGTVWVPALQHQLTQQAALLFPVLPESADHDYPPPTVTFDGQTANLRGKVRHAAQRLEAERRVRENIRVSLPFTFGLGRDLNPVTHVINEIQVEPFPPGWLLLVAQGKYARLTGAAANDYEARDAAASVSNHWIAAGGRIEAKVTANSSHHDEAAAAETTLSNVPTPLGDAGSTSAQVYLARLGEHWQKLDLNAADNDLRTQAIALGLRENEWDKILQPTIATTRRYQKQQQAKEAEVARQATLPPPHVFLAARSHRILVRGEVASLRLKREFLHRVIEMFPDWKVLDDIRINADRRAVANFGLITTALLPSSATTETGKLALGLTGREWTILTVQPAPKSEADAAPGSAPVPTEPKSKAKAGIGNKSQPKTKPVAEPLPTAVSETTAPPAPQAPALAELLPQDLPLKLVAEDEAFVRNWLTSDLNGIPTLPLRAQPSYLTLALLPDRVILAGQLAEEAFRSQLIEAVQRIYGPKVIIHTDGLLARGTCEPSTDVEQTKLSFPALPAVGQPPVLAFTLPGRIWKTIAADPRWLEPGALAESGILPKNFPSSMAEDTFVDAFDYIRNFWEKEEPPLPTKNSIPKSAADTSTVKGSKAPETKDKGSKP